jgi:hypothetical protein
MRIEGARELTPTETDMDLRPRTVALERQYGDLHGRLSELEKWQRKSEVEDARMDVRFTEMDKKLNAISSNLSKLMWMVIAGIVAGIIAFMMNGGFANAKQTAEAVLEATRPVMPAARSLQCPIDKPIPVKAYCRASSSALPTDAQDQRDRQSIQAGL